MSVPTRAACALLATIVAGGLTVAVTLFGGPASVSGPKPALAAVGHAQPGSGPALDAVLGLTRSVGGQPYRVGGTYSAGSALTSIGAR